MNEVPLKIAAVVFPGFELLDLYGPLELFGLLKERVSLSIVAQETGLIASSQGPRTAVDVALSEFGKPDIVLVPGGMGTRREVNNAPLLELLRELSKDARFVTSVCTGSALLARAGILDGRKATSNKRAFDWVVSQGPNVDWVRDARWVEDGRYFTSSGVSAGMDMSLGLIQHIWGAELCTQVAQWAEYHWNNDKTSDPFAALNFPNS